MNASIKRASIVVVASLGLTVAFQNCGSFQGTTGVSSLSSSAGIRGNNVAESGLAGKDVVQASSIKIANAAAGGQNALVTCAADQSSCLALGMPLINQNQMPTPFASMYCVPTSATMAFEAFQRAGFTFPRNEGPEFSALTSSEQRALWLGNRMKTDANGTYAYPEMMTLDSLIYSATPAYQLRSDNYTVTPDKIKQDAIKNGIGLMSYGHYVQTNQRLLLSNRMSADFQRNGGHSIAINGFRSAQGQTQIVYNDPWDANQYARVFLTLPVDGDMHFNFPYVSADGKSSNYAVFTYGQGPSLGAEFIDAYYPLEASPASRVIPGAQPTVDPNVTAAQALVQSAYQNVLNRAADPAGLAAYTASVLGGMTQARVEASLRDSDEYRSLHPAPNTTPTPVVVQPPPTVTEPPAPVQSAQVNDRLVNKLYQSFLKRAADQSAYNYWSPQTPSQIARGIAASDEGSSYWRNLDDRSFVTYLYRAMLFREPAEWEVTYWAGSLTAGQVTRVQVIDGFANSPEFKADPGAF